MSIQYSEDYMLFAKNLNNYLKKTGMRKIDLARIVGVGTASVCDWTAGKSIPRAGKLQAIAELFNCEITDLIGSSASPVVDARVSENEEFLEMLRLRPECRELFRIVKSAKKAEVEKAIRIIVALRGDSTSSEK